MELLHSTNLVQHVNEITHILAHIIDLIVACKGQDILYHLHASTMLSLHFVV